MPLGDRPLAIVWGTRPEAIKLGPVVAELRARSVPLQVICTNQHKELLRGTPAESDLCDSISLGMTSTGDVLRWTRVAVRAIRHEFAKNPGREPRMVVVQGDTMSAVAGARAAEAQDILLAHIEAGVRSHTIVEPWPEEGFRREISVLAHWHYAPTDTCRKNLLAEGVPDERIFVTGNPGVSAIARYTDARPVAEPQTPTILVTLHRRELANDPHLDDILRALGDTADQFPALRFLWPQHPGLKRELNGVPNLRVVPPVDYRSCVLGLALSAGVLTDSGGLQEEAATLGVPCAVFRNVTDRPESVDAGIAQVFARTPEGMRRAVRALATQMIPRRAEPVFGDANSASRIAEHLASL